MRIMTCNILVLFANDSEKLAMELINQFDNVPINYICVNNNSLQLSNMQQKTQAKIHVVFFSPDFLRFLENNVLDAYHICGHLDSKSSVAVFCLGIKVENVLCYHMAPLKSFQSWNKFEVLKTPNGNHVFPNELMNRINEVLTQFNFAAEDIIVVPQFLKRHNNTIYTIFPSPIEDCHDLYIRLNDHEDIDISLKKLNPYVMKFSVPDSLFQFSHNVIIRIQIGEQVITNQVVHLSQDTPKNAQVNGTENAENDHPKLLTRQELFLDEQIKYLKGISGLNTEDEKSSLNSESRTIKTEDAQGNTKENTKFDLKKLCKQYGLERLSLLMSDTSSNSKDKDDELTGTKLLRYSRLMNDLPEMDSSNRMNSFLVQEAGGHKHLSLCRSLSLPSTLLPTSDTRNSFGGYLEMGGKEPSEMKPHERLLMGCKHLERRRSNDSENLQNDIMNSISSGHYMTLRMSNDEVINTRALLKKGLSSSQQELLDLMEDFKDGECTMSYVENQFQLWRERHCRKATEADKRTRKTSALGMFWKKPKKKDLKIVIENKETAKTNADVKEEKISTRKISNTSASSSSSKASDKSLSTATSKEDGSGNEQRSDDGTAPTGWVSSYSPTANRIFFPRYPKTEEPPPLPSRPPPWAKMNTINKTLLRKTLPNATNDTTDVIMEEKSPDLIEDSDDDYEEDEERKASMYELCQKYGLQKLGVCFVTGECPIQDDKKPLVREKTTNTNKNKTLQRKTVDSEGYEIPIKKKLGSFEKNSSHTNLRRSFSLPSNLSQSYELPDDLLDSTESENPHPAENQQNACICDHCNENYDCFTNNFYMSLLELRRDNSVNETSILTQSCLSRSQQELLDLMYAFKRGEQTMSQAEQQFQEWHSRHMGNCPHNFILPYPKLPKQTSFALPGFMKILGKQKKKTSADNKFDLELEKSRMKNSEEATSAQKRLSKLSHSSTSSANSEWSGVSKATMKNMKSPEAAVDLTPPVCPKRPPPVPPKRPLYTKELPKTSQIIKEQTSPALATNTEIQKPKKGEKPIPPPKPKFRLNSNSTGPSESEAPHTAEEQSNKTEESKQDVEENSNDRPISSIYVTPDTHPRPVRPKLQRQAKEICSTQKWSTLQNRQPFSSAALANLPAPRCRNITEPSEADTLSQLTLELLKKANLFNPNVTKPMFYVRRSNSDPNIKLSEPSEIKKKPPPVKKRHIYLEILPPLENDQQYQCNPVTQNTIAS
ncbi:uncharacterized protein LOC129972832 isoform X2 [Argiope bruennichi]|uniref:uncharacterized protein LOC129972832 isoform X2 n=1 Tax=Argiope bruennichi TaxID=94029 RepID=UPI002493ED75|nr:uncharacterized protein LOC129972832 isoform X2 [Argiope bruennichi]